MNTKAFEPLELLQYDKLKEVSDYVKKELSESQKTIIKNLTKIIDGFQSALSLEILATVDFVSKDKSLKNEDIVRTIHNWSDRKKKLFQDKYIDLATSHLQKYSGTLEIK